MKIGDLITYVNPQRMIPLTLGVILDEQFGISIDQRFYWVLLSNGTKRLISEHYISLPGEKQP